MQYKVTKQYQRGTESLDKYFKTLADANAHVQTSAESDAAMNVNVMYRVYDFDDLLQVVDSSKVQPSVVKDETPDTGSQGKQSGASFRPTPFEMAPRPKDTPPKWIIDPDEEKKEEN